MEQQLPHNVTKNLVIFDSDGNHSKNYLLLLKKLLNERLQFANGDKLRIVQCGWEQVECTTFSNGSIGCLLTVHGNPVMDHMEGADNADKHAPSVFSPHAVIVQDAVKTSKYDGTSLLYGLFMGNVQSVNSLQSILKFMERPVIYGALRAIEKRRTFAKFPRTFCESCLSCKRNTQLVK